MLEEVRDKMQSVVPEGYGGSCAQGRSIGIVHLLLKLGRGQRIRLGHIKRVGMKTLEPRVDT